MKVLMISGDSRMLEVGTEAHERFLLQQAQVDELKVFARKSGEPKLVAAVRMIWQGRKETWDVVTAQDPFLLGHIALHITQGTGAKLQLQVHTDFSMQPVWKRIFGALNLRRAHSVRVVSEKIKKQVEVLGVRAPIFVLPIFLDVGQFRNLVHKSHSIKTILWIGRFESEKDPLDAISILEKIRKIGTDVKLVMLGAGSLEKKLYERAGGLPVEFVGWKDPKEFLPTADVVVCTSMHESWGASMIEALAAGVPVVAPDVGVAREAGAVIKSKPELAAGVEEVLRSGTRGELKLKLLNKEEWARAWRETLPK